MTISTFRTAGNFIFVVTRRPNPRLRSTNLEAHLVHPTSHLPEMSRRTTLSRGCSRRKPGSRARRCGAGHWPWRMSRPGAPPQPALDERATPAVPSGSLWPAPFRPHRRDARRCPSVHRFVARMRPAPRSLADQKLKCPCCLVSRCARSLIRGLIRACARGGYC